MGLALGFISDMDLFFNMRGFVINCVLNKNVRGIEMTNKQKLLNIMRDHKLSCQDVANILCTSTSTVFCYRARSNAKSFRMISDESIQKIEDTIKETGGRKYIDTVNIMTIF